MCGAGGYAQVVRPTSTQLPAINAVPYNWFKGYVRIDSAIMPPVRDTNFIPLVAQTLVIRPQDSAEYTWNGKAWFPKRGFATITPLFEKRGTKGQVTSVRGYYLEGDGGEAAYRWDDTAIAAVDSGSVIAPPGLSVGRWKLITDKTAVNAKAFGVKQNDTTFDNAPRLNAALRYSGSFGVPILINANTASDFAYRSQITIPLSADVTLGNNCRLVCYMSNTDSTTIHINVLAETRVEMMGELLFNRRRGRAIYISGRDGVYRKSEEEWNFNVRGDQIKGQIAIYILADGQNLYGSAPVSYIKLWHNQIFNVDYAIYAKSINRGNINNNIITGAYGQTLRGIYFFSDLSIDTALGIGRASINYLTLIGNITSSPNTKQLFYLSGVSGSVIDMKLEDAGRYADSSNQFAFFSDKNCADNNYELKGFKSQNFHDEGMGNDFNFHSHRKGILDVFGAQSNTVLPNGTLPRKAGSLDDYLLGTSVDGGLTGKPFTIATTNSQNGDGLKNLFDNDATTRMMIDDAGNQERQIKIAFDHPVRGFAGGVEFGSINEAPSYVRVEAWSTDSAKKYTLFETDTGWYNFNLWYNFNGKIFKDTLTTVIINGEATEVIKRHKRPLTRMDTLYVTVKGFNWETGADTINIDRIWLFAEGENAKSFIGNGAGDQDLYQRLQLRKGANLHNDTLTNAFLATGLMYFRDINDFEEDTLWIGNYSYTGSTLNAPPGSAIGTVAVLKTGIGNMWIRNTGQSLSFIAHDLTNNVIWRRGYKHATNTYSAWDSSAGSGGGGGIVDWSAITNKPATFAPTSHVHPLSEVTDDGTMATQNDNAVAITGGTINGLTQLSLPTASSTTDNRIWLSSNALNYRSAGVTYSALRASSNLADVTSPAAALNNLLPTQTGNANKALVTNGSAASWTSVAGANILGFDSIDTGTNTTAAMTIGSGASMLVTGTGRNEATVLKGSGSTTDAVDLATAEASGTLPISKGGTNAVTASAGLNNMLPAQTGNSGKILATDGTNASWVVDQTGSGGLGSGDVTSNTTTSVVNELAVFNSTTGKQIGRATGTGIAKLTAGVLGTATSGTDYAPSTGATGAILKGNGSGGFTNAVAGTDYPAVVNYSFLVLTFATNVSWNVTRVNARLTLTGNCSLAVSNVVQGVDYRIQVFQDATGARTLTLPVGSVVPIGFGSGRTINLTTRGGAFDMLSFVYDGTRYIWSILKDPQ